MDFYLVKSKHIFFKSPLHFQKIKIMLKLTKNVLINELYKGEIFHGKKMFKINALLPPN
jgi:hypothetical protein